MTTLEDIRRAWEIYGASRERADELRDELRDKIADAVASGISQSAIAATLGIARQSVHRYLAD